jgi:bacillithiol biosynthesis deacetylase BshB1
MLQLLALAPHPDDAEIGLGGTLARFAAAGRPVAIADLTRGEMGTNGTPEERVAEGEAAARILGLALRTNLGLPDRGLTPADPAQVRAIVDLIRTHRPAVLAIPYGEDRHPDHRAASALCYEAWFSAGLRRYETAQPPHRPTLVYYFINNEREPSFVVDVTAFYEQKLAALAAHRSQFGAGGVATRLNSATGLLHLMQSRDGLFGARAGVRYAEGFYKPEPLRLEDPLHW